MSKMQGGNMGSNYKYIFDDESLLSIPIREVLAAGGCVEKGNTFFCPHEHKKPQSLKIFNDTNTCHCHNCKTLGSGTTIAMATLFKGDYVEGKRWLSDIGNVPKIINPDYNPNYKNFNTSVVSPLPKIKKTCYEIEYQSFNSYKDFVNISLHEVYQKYNKMSKSQKLKMVYTAIYRLALATDQKAKYSYYSKRGIAPSERMEKIAYLSTNDFNTLEDVLKKWFPLEDLIEFAVLSDAESKTPHRWKLGYVKKGGLLLVPSFDLYTDMVTGFMARPTHPPKWMIEKKMKEIQISQTHLIKPLPFGLTYEMLNSTSPFVFTTEGHPDALALPETMKIDEVEHKIFCIATPGTHGYSDEMLGLLKGKKVLLAYDQDEAGKKGALGSVSFSSQEDSFVFIDNQDGYQQIKLLKDEYDLRDIEYTTSEHAGLLQRLWKASVDASHLEWDEKLGIDVNDVKINGNIDVIVEIAISQMKQN